MASGTSIGHEKAARILAEAFLETAHAYEERGLLEDAGTARVIADGYSLAADRMEGADKP